jgi:hypothetical protein
VNQYSLKSHSWTVTSRAANAANRTLVKDAVPDYAMMGRCERSTALLCQPVPRGWPAIPHHPYAAWASNKCVSMIARHFIDESNLEYYASLQATPILETAGSEKIDSVSGIRDECREVCDIRHIYNNNACRQLKSGLLIAMVQQISFTIYFC